MINLLASELFRLRKRSQSWILLAINILLIGLVYGGFVIAARVTKGAQAEAMRSAVTFESFQNMGIALALGMFGAVMLIIVAAGMMGNEFSWNTLRPLVARATSRSAILTSKLIALVIYAILFVLVMTIVVAGMYLIGSKVVDRPSGFSFDVLVDGFGYAVRVLYASAPYLAFAFMLATVFRSNVAGIAGALGLSFIEQPIFALLGLASNFFNDLSHWGISYNQAQLVADNSSMIGRSSMILAAYTIICIAISYMVFLRRDVVSG